MQDQTLPASPETRNRILSIDVDDLLIANADFFGEAVPPDYSSDIEREIRGALDLIDSCEAQATFFVNAQYCERHPAAIREIAARGHSLASHGFRHRNIAALSLDEFETDLCRSLEQLTRIGSPIVGYRPPAFSMPYDEEHLRILQRNGIRYVSSGVGVARSNAPRSNRPVELAEGILHVPISTLHLLGGRVKYPIGYGVTSRLMPEGLYMRSLREWLARRDYFHWYCHTFELSGLSSAFSIPYRGLSARVSTALYAWRCRNREGFMKAVLKSARFLSIEASLMRPAVSPDRLAGLEDSR